MRRALPTLAAALLALAAAPAAEGARHHRHHGHAPRARPVLLVANSVAGTVDLYATAPWHHLGTLDVIPDGDTPHDPVLAAAYPAIVAKQGLNYAQDMALSPDGSTLYVSRGYLGDVAAFDLRTRALLWRTQVAGLRSDHLALTPDGRRLFVSAITANEVQAIDTQTHAILGSYPAGDWPHSLGIGPDGLVWSGSLGNQLLPRGHDGSHLLVAADPSTLRVVRSFALPDGIRPFAFTRDGRRLYLQLSFFNGFFEYDPQTGARLRTAALPLSDAAKALPESQYPNQAAHHGIALSRGDRYVCDAATISDYVAIVRRSDLRTMALVPVGATPAWAIASLDGRSCLVASRTSDTVSAISFAKRRETARLPTGANPQFELEARLPAAVLAGWT